MALVNCPECNQKISDTSDKCIHCGYVLGKSRKIVEVSGISLNKNNKRYLFVSFCIILIILMSGYIFKEYKNYECGNEISMSLSRMKISGASSKLILEATYMIWSSAIDSGVNFNDSIATYYSDDGTKKLLDRMKRDIEIMKIMFKRVNRMEFFIPKSLYDSYSNLYSAYNDMIRLSLQPEGSLITFGAKKNEVLNKFDQCYETVEVKLGREIGLFGDGLSFPAYLGKKIQSVF